MSNISLSKWIQKFDNGDFSYRSTAVQCDAGWYDWFCRETSLMNKTLSLGKKVKSIAKSPKVNVDTMYVFFKNNCPMVGTLYDDFRICDLETGDVIFTIVPKCGHTSKKGVTEIWGQENDFDAPLYEGDWKGALKWFGVGGGR